MRTRRLFGTALAAAAGWAAILALGSLPVLADTPIDGAPVGSVVVNAGVTDVNSSPVTVHVDATDADGVAFVELFLNGGSVTGRVAYAGQPFQVDLPYEGQFNLRATWWDAFDQASTSADVPVTLDTTRPPLTLFTPDDPNPDPGVMLVGFQSDATQLAAVQLSANGSAWSPDIDPGPISSNTVVVPYHRFDPALGGSPKLGPRTVYVKVRDLAGNWSPTRSESYTASVSMPIAVSPARPVTGHTVTLTPQYPLPVSFPAGTHCYWEVLWGDDQSLYYGNRDETFGFFYTYGPASGGYCDARSFTMPWMPYPQVMVSFRAEVGGSGEAIAEASIGGSPTDAPIVPVVGSTSRRITSSNIPMVYVLPEDYTLVLGQPTTYRAYSVKGAPITSRDSWAAEYINVPQQQWGGTSFTFTPRVTGYLTVCWGTDSTKSTRYAACYDPRVRHRDRSRPNTSAPVARINSGAVGATVPARVTWNGSDVGWGIRTYQLDRSLDGGPWKRVLSGRVKAYAPALTPGHSYRYRVRAIDKAGNVGAWDYGPTLRPAVASDSSASLTYRGTWLLVADPTARGGSLHESMTAASTARLTFKGRDVAWLAERGPGHGRARVYVDGTLVTTVDLNATVDAPARIVFRKHWSTRASHTVRVVVEGTAGHPTVDVDGFVILR